MCRTFGILILVVLLGFFSPLVAQTKNGNLFINVTDESGSALTDVELTLTGASVTRSTTSDGKGVGRFVELTPGVYELTLKQNGYSTMVLQGIQIDSGASASFDVALQRSSLVEKVVVVAATPLLDRRAQGTTTVFSKSEIEQVPQARDPWSIISTVPGVTTDRVNVAGSEAGQQAAFVGKGVVGQSAWFMDGIEFTGAGGGSETYLDFNSFEQITFETAGGGVQSLAPGVQLDFVTKQGSNRHTGTFRLLFTDSQLQDDNTAGLSQPDWVDPETPLTGNRINEIFEKNFDIGGPFVRDRLWYWFGFTQNDIDVQLLTGQSDRTTLRNISGKLHGQEVGGRLNYRLFYTNGDKIKLGRDGGVDRPPETTWDQTGPIPIYSAALSYFVNSDLEFTGQYGKVEGGFTLMPSALGDFSQQIFRDENGVFHRTYSKYETDRPQEQVLAKGNYFVETGSWDHEFKFGFRYKTSTVNSFSKYSEADLIASKFYTPHYVYLYRELATKVDLQHTNAWFGDTLLHGPWTVSVGLHYSRQTGEQAPSASAPNGTFPTLVEGLEFSGFDPGFTWSDFAPRVGASYTFDWKKRLLLRASYSHYANQLRSWVVTYNLPLTYVGVSYGWNDLNGNDIVDGDELYKAESGNFTDPVDITSDETACVDALGWYAIDPCDTGSASSPNRIDPDLSAPQSDQFIVGADYEIAKDFTVGLSYTYGKRDNLIWGPFYSASTGRVADLNQVYGTNAGPISIGNQTSVNGREYTGEYYVIVDDSDLSPSRGRLETNDDQYGQRYDGLELVATKRLSNRWRMRAFIAYTKWTNDFSGGVPFTAAEYSLAAVSGDPTNLRGGTTDDGGLISVQSVGSGNKRDVFVGSSTWQFSVNGLYQLPKLWSVSGNLYSREGYGLPYYHQVSADLTNAEGSKSIQIGRLDTLRYPNLVLLDLRVSKTFAIDRNVTVELAGELFNALNEDTVLQQNQCLSCSTVDRIGEILSPRVWRFVAVVNF